MPTDARESVGERTAKLRVLEAALLKLPPASPWQHALMLLQALEREGYYVGRRDA